MIRLSVVEREYLSVHRVMRLATVSHRGMPSNVPMVYGFDGRDIFFVTQKMSAKVRNLQRHPLVAVVVDEYSEDWPNYRGILLQGRAQIIRSAREVPRLRRLLYAKYPQFARKFPVKEGTGRISVRIQPERKKVFGSWTGEH